MLRPRVGGAVLGLMLLSSLACASEYCTKEQYQHDHALIENAFSTGMLVKGPKGLRDSILVQEGIWFEGSDVNLRTAEGAEARLGSEDFKSKEARLAAVLADLAARKQRPALVDLRFKDTAVVKLASR